MSKKLFLSLIKKAATPVPKELDIQLHPDGNSGKQTRPHKAANASGKRSGTSRESNASAGPKSPR